MEEENEFIERKIVIGLITSTEFTKAVRDVFSTRLLTSTTAKRLSGWCIEYFDQFERAPGRDIEGVYMDKLKRGMAKDVAQDVEGILQDLNDEYIQSEKDIEVLIKQTRKFFSEQHLEEHVNKIRAALESGDVTEAESLANTYKPILSEEDSAINFSNPKTLENVERAFSESQDPLIYYPKALGQFWNEQFIRGAFVALMAPEKRGKTYLLLDMAHRAVKQGRSIAFFQAGDMSEGQQIRRFCIHLAKNSDKEQYCGEMYEPIPDCIYNQLNTCTRVERECDFGIFSEREEEDLRDSINFDELKEAFELNPNYRNCFNCKEYQTNPWGAPYFTKVNIKRTLDLNKAKRLFEKEFILPKRNLVLSSHANSTLTVSKIRSLLDMWEKKDGFVPDVIIIDYADILAPEKGAEFRHQQNEIWKSLRRLSQEKRGDKEPLVITVTQTDADSYDRGVLSLKNFSEDKRKYAHVTAFFGMNQDPQGREKKLGVLRINKILVREGEFDPKQCVHVLQNLKRGLPYIGSYF